MTHTTDEELDALVERLQNVSLQVGFPSRTILDSHVIHQSAEAINALRAQLAEARTELVRRVDMHECAMAERDDATLYSDEQKARAERAEAALAAQIEAERFDKADWFWRTMDPDDSADTPSEAIHRGFIGHFCVCEIASSYTGPTRYGFIAPVLDQGSNDEEFLHFATQQEAIDAANDRISALRAIGEGEG